jgi:hypothetical protein
MTLSDGRLPLDGNFYQFVDAPKVNTTMLPSNSNGSSTAEFHVELYVDQRFFGLFVALGLPAAKPATIQTTTRSATTAKTLGSFVCPMSQRYSALRRVVVGSYVLRKELVPVPTILTVCLTIALASPQTVLVR